MRFHDCQMYSPERLALECLLDARDAGAVLVNHTTATGFLREGERITGALVSPTGASQENPIAVQAALTVNAAGPWADILMGALSEAPAARRLIRSKGIHLITRPLTSGHAIAIQTASGHFFLLPWRGHTLIGTTDTVFEGDPSEVAVTEADIAAFLAVVNQGLPSARLTRQDVLHFYGGLRPIVESEGGGCGGKAGSYGASRAPEVYDHASEHGLQGVITAIGGKWTTSRALAEDVVDMALRKLGRSPVAATTAERPTRGGHTGRFAAYSEAACQAQPAWPAATIQHLVKTYGSRYEDVLRIAEAEPSLAAPLGARFPDIGAQVAYAVREELACNLDDVLFRRTGLGTLGHPGEDTVASVMAVLTAELGWDADEQARQRARLPRYFVPQPSPVIAAA
jgi:glycerol-3-phosphate dehydrogenase